LRCHAHVRRGHLRHDALLHRQALITQLPVAPPGHINTGQVMLSGNFIALRRAIVRQASHEA
jgi:hypothetical protein